MRENGLERSGFESTGEDLVGLYELVEREWWVAKRATSSSWVPERRRRVGVDETQPRYRRAVLGEGGRSHGHLATEWNQTPSPPGQASSALGFDRRVVQLKVVIQSGLVRLR